MDEFEKLEGELAQQYAIYVQKFRNLEYLEHQLEQYNQVEQEKLAESKRALERMHKRLREVHPLECPFASRFNCSTWVSAIADGLSSIYPRTVQRLQQICDRFGFCRRN